MEKSIPYFSRKGDLSTPLEIREVALKIRGVALEIRGYLRQLQTPFFDRT